MGKDSLIKSTSKKKTKSASEEETKKKTVKKAAAKPKKAAKPKAAKKAPAKTTKATAAKTTAKKTKSAAKPKTKAAAAKPKAKTAAAKPSAKKSAAAAKPKAKPKAAAKKTKKATIPELLAKKFDSLPGAPKPKPATAEKKVFEESPPIVTTSDPEEAARIRGLLMTKFSMAEIKAVAKPPEPKKPKAAAKPAEPETPEAAAPEAPTPEPEAPKAETPATKAVETPAAPADEPPVITTDLQEDTPEPISRGIKYGIAAAALIVLILLGISHNNSSKYYIHPKEGALEIWKGQFSPKDKEFFMVLHGVQLDQEAKALYSRNEVYPMIFDYYLDKADTLLEVPGLPDFEGIKDYLYQAESYVITPEMKDSVKSRLNSIERMILLYRADVAISKNTSDSLRSAMKDLQKASGLVANETQKQEIDQKIERIKILREELKAAGK